MTGHARLGCSNQRWPHCAGSIRVEADYEDTSGAAAIDGTGSHLQVGMCLDNGVRAEAYLGQIIGQGHPDMKMGWMVSQDRVDRVQMALDYIKRRYDELNAQFTGCRIDIHSESISNPGEICGRDDWWGTADITITVTDPKTDKVLFIEVADYKDGRGWVNAKSNTQLISYLSGKMAPHVYVDAGRIMDASMLQGCRMTIIQPKTSPVIRYDEPAPQEVADAHFKLIQAAKATDDPYAPLVAGKHCQWCKHKKNCTAESEQSIERILPMIELIPVAGGSLFETVEATFGDITALPTEKLTELADSEAGIMSIFTKVKEEIETRLKAGQEVDGFVIAPGNSSRAWNADEETIAKMLKGRRMKKDEIYPSKLISPAQVEKSPLLTDTQKAAIMKEYVTSVEGKMSLKKVARKPKVTADEMFSDVISEQPVATAETISFM